MRTSLLVAVLLAAPLALAHAAAGPLTQVKESNGRIDRILKRKTAPGSPEERAARTELKSIVNGFIDYHELAVRALAQHWGELNRKQQDEFVSALRELIEKNYVKRLHTNVEYEVIYKNESLGGDGQATVATVVKVHTAGKSTDTSIDYALKKSGDKWMVFDVVTDEVSMVKNYKQQFNKIISNESFEGLMRKMRKSIDSADESKPEAVK